LIASWNAQTPPGSGIEIQARVIDGEKATQFYTLGRWATGTQSPRESVTGQKDEDGDVQTDMLILKRPSRRAQIRLTLTENKDRAKPNLRFLALNFSRQSSAQPNLAWSRRLSPVRILRVPARAQLAYPEGRDWCSPACVSMVLAYWGALLNRPDLKIDVPEVAAGVYDRNWPGTGNWPFNTAFAGELTGMRAFVTRLRDLSEVETLLGAGVPPILSVSFNRLNGRASHTGTGHLVVIVGFDERGNAVLNDPWAFGQKAGTVRRSVSVQNLLSAWSHSHNTVYLIYPDTWSLPRSPESHW
jgi:hypothetical protein